MDNATDTRTKPANVRNIAFHGKVVDNEDPINSKRVKVKLEVIDDGKTTDQIAWCVSLMPNFFFCVPQIGEHVVVMFMNPWDQGSTRLYMGPLQTENFGEQQYADSGRTAGTMNTFGFVTFDRGEDDN